MGLTNNDTDETEKQLKFFQQILRFLHYSSLVMKKTNNQTVFKRMEKKYLITSLQYERIMDAVNWYASPDVYKSCTVFSLYFDTPTHLLIRRSIDKPVYKEKLRLRTYGIPAEDSPVFVELKKKYKKTVYKRRAEMAYADAAFFLMSNIIPEGYQHQRQILNEISWFLRLYRPLAPSMLISYDRTAFCANENHALRITFDRNVLWRDTELSPTEGAWGTPLLRNDQSIMEVKIPGAMPLWLADALAEAEIYPTSFSKYGTAYQQKFLKGGIHYA